MIISALALIQLLPELLKTGTEIYLAVSSAEAPPPYERKSYDQVKEELKAELGL